MAAHAMCLPFCEHCCIDTVCRQAKWLHFILCVSECARQDCLSLHVRIQSATENTGRLSECWPVWNIICPAVFMSHPCCVNRCDVESG